jgi:hypothetical protein
VGLPLCLIWLAAMLVLPWVIADVLRAVPAEQENPAPCAAMERREQDCSPTEAPATGTVPKSVSDQQSFAAAGAVTGDRGLPSPPAPACPPGTRLSRPPPS